MRKILKYIILFLIQSIEKWEYRNFDLDENDISKKILDSQLISDYEIESDNGWVPISEIHQTQPYTIWRVELENGMWLEGADNHILFDSFMEEIFIKDLRIGHHIQTKEGLQKIINIAKLPYKVSMYDVTVDNKDHRYYSNGILSHNTTTISAFFAWYLCFHTDRNLAILANKEKTTFEIVRKVTEVFKGLPFFLKPGIESIGAGGMRLDNGCMLVSQATTDSAQIGFTIHILYIDEFAHVKPNIANDFWSSVYPTLASSEISQCIISSTPKGQENLFFKIWDKANRGKNTFEYKRVDYWEVKEHNTPEWISKMKANFGEERFAQEFELKFDITSNNLLAASHLIWTKRLTELTGSYEFKELDKTELDDLIYRKLEWSPNFDPNNVEKDDRFVLSIDLAEGKDEEELKDNDYNVIQIFKVKLKSLAKLRKLRRDQHLIENLFRLEQIGVYHDNIQDETMLGKVAKAVVFDQFNPEHTKVVIEMNFNGKAALNEFQRHDEYFDGVVMRSFHTAPIPGERQPPKKPGFKQRRDKDHFCRFAKKLIGEKSLISNHEETLLEFTAFEKVKTQWKGVGRHDDLAISIINVARLFVEPEYKDWLYDYLDEMIPSLSKEFALKIIDEPFDESEIDDDMFSALYSDEQQTIEEIFEYESKDKMRFRPSSSLMINT